MRKIIESLSPNERKVIPYLYEKNIRDLCRKSNLDRVSVIRVLEFLNNKGIIKINYKKKKIIEIGVNGAFYRKKGLPERRLLNLLNEKRILSLIEAQKLSKLSNEEFKAALGVLKNKAMIELKNGKIFLNANPQDITKKSLEELFIESIPLDYETLTPEQQFALNSLQKRKNIINVAQKNEINFELTDLGNNLIKEDLGKNDLIGEINSDLLRKDSNWKSKKFRRYDVSSPVPQISGGKRHFVNQAIDYSRKIWLDMGFREMSGNLIQGSFWNFDALFTAQDHPVREMQDTFFLNKEISLPEKKIVEKVKESHEKGVGGSKGWGGEWKEENAREAVLRTHTTCLSARTLVQLKKEDLPAKFFAIGKTFRNETVDWSHGFEFNQTEGIVVDRNANFRNLLGYLKQFFKKMGFEKIRFSPAYFPYTEPSVEIHIWHPERKIWLELGGAGIFRPELTIPLLGEHIPVLAWGPGFDRIIMDYYQIKDLRELYKNDLNKLREIKFWVKN